MGKLIYSQWANLIALTAGVFELIGSIFGIFYRIAMFGHINPALNSLVEPVNFLSIAGIVSALIILAIEWPLRPLKSTFLVTAYLPRIMLYIPISIVSILNYQNVNPALYLFVATLLYTIALVNRENRQRLNAQYTPWNGVYLSGVTSKVLNNAQTVSSLNDATLWESLQAIPFSVVGFFNVHTSTLCNFLMIRIFASSWKKTKKRTLEH